MDKKGSVRTYFTVKCEQHGLLPDANGTKYHGTRGKAENIGTDHALAKHLAIASQRVRIKRRVTVDVEIVSPIGEEKRTG